VLLRYVAVVAVTERPEKLVALIETLTLELPIDNPDVVRFTFAPTLIAVEILAVAGSLAVARVPLEMLVALAANVVALVYAAEDRVVA
jgi:hypothetical protein